MNQTNENIEDYNDCNVCYGCGWVIGNDDLKIPFCCCGSINDLLIGDEVIRCWECNQVSWLPYQPKAIPKFEETCS